MAEINETTVLEPPRVYLVHMVVFTLVVVVLAAVLFPNIKNAFLANVGLNGLIIGILLLGVLYAYRMVWRLFPEINWVNGFRVGQSSDENLAEPVLLAPMATLLGDRQERTVLSTNTMRSLLDSLASRLDESRDLMRYLVGLLIFLGLLGTFWGLLQTVTSVGDAIKNLDVGAGQSSSMFEELKTGLQRPLEGMGLSFSASLFGLAGSLILGFLDLKASQAQNRFYHNLEDWLSTITDIQVGEGGQTGTTNYLRFDMQGLQRGLDKVGKQLEGVKTNGAGAITMNRLNNWLKRWPAWCSRCAKNRKWCANGRKASRCSRMKSSACLSAPRASLRRAAVARPTSNNHGWYPFKTQTPGRLALLAGLRGCHGPASAGHNLSCFPYS